MSGLHSPTEETMESNICLTKDQFARLILAARRSRNSFTSTTITYDGVKDPAKAEEFITCISLYKSFENIRDEDALMTLPLVLKKDAFIWWSVVKDELNTWLDFETRFRQTFAPIKPPYVIYREIFATHQSPGEMTEMFIIKKRALFSKLPPPGLGETQQLDMIYGLLNLDIREDIPRDTVTSYQELITAARRVEEVLMLDQFESTPNQPQVRCKYCRSYGHTIEVCRKHRKVMRQRTAGGSHHDAAETISTGEAFVQAPLPSQIESCCGCGASGVVRTNCSTCALRSREISFNAIDIINAPKTDSDCSPVKLPRVNFV